MPIEVIEILVDSREIEITDSGAGGVEILTAATSVVDVTLPGPQGPMGPQGPSGPIGSVYHHTQSTPATTWVVNHNLGFHPHVSVWVGAVEVSAEVVNITTNIVHVLFDEPMTGMACAS